MAKGRADISNFALRVFLQKVGQMYDTQRGFEPFKPTKKQWITVSNFFGGRCCYCNAQLNREEATEDLCWLLSLSIGFYNDFQAKFAVHRHLSEIQTDE
jgi:hypothetical protein